MRAALAFPVLSALLLSSPAALANGEAINGFPDWQERVMLEWTNRARCDPQVEMAKCGSACGEGACYTPIVPVVWNEKLNHAARFHSDNMKAINFFSHPSACTLVSNINAIYPGTCQGAASCACVGGVAGCSPTCTDTFSRIALFGTSGSGEIIASGTDPDGAFYQWLFEGYAKSTCAYDQGPPTNGHRWNLLKAGPAYGFGSNGGPSVGDSGGSGAPTKIVTGTHYPRQSGSVEAWANWYDAAGPKAALVNVDGTCTAMTLGRGSVTNGAYKATISSAASGCHRYFFLFTDAQSNLVTYPTTGSLGIGPANSCADWDATRPPTGAGCACTPLCAGKTCGDDGCGGSCGNCAGNTTCQSNQCVGTTTDGGVPPAGDGGVPGKDGGVPPGGDGGVPPGGDGGLGADPGAADGCSCDTAGRSEGGASAGLLGVLGALALAARRRRARTSSN